MSHTRETRLKPVSKLEDDSVAFRLFVALCSDVSSNLPQGCAEYLIGKVRARDYEFFVVTLPSVAMAIATVSEWKGAVVFERFTIDREVEVETLYLLAGFLAKYPFNGSKVYTDDTRRAAAMASFQKANKWCRRMNALGVRNQGRDNALIARARSVIRRILPKFDWQKAVSRSYFGPGVNVGVSWEETDTQVKLLLTKTCTPSLARQLGFAATLLPAQVIYEGIRAARGFDYPSTPDPALWEVPAERRYDFLVALGLDAISSRVKVVDGSIYAAVPKNAKTFRSIAKEPMLNSFLQNGIGAWMAEILATYSVQLDRTDQTRNQTLAYAASAGGFLATIDLSSASDTICLWLAKALLPADWYEAMRLVRSPTIDIDGRRTKLHMLSSMGNGYTFPLETLLFYAISVAAITLADETADVAPNEGGPGANREPSVYGDDIIVTSQDAPHVLRALRDCGFWPNPKKSFFAGPYRESCGHDYRNGQYIRPVFLRRPLIWTFDVASLINHLSNPAGFGWYTMRYGTLFSAFCKSLVDLSNAHHPHLPVGPCGPTHVATYVRVPLQLMRKRGTTRKLRVSDEDAAVATRTEYYYPLVIRARSFRDVEDIAAYLASLLKRPEVGHFSLYSRVKRGEVDVCLQDRGSPTGGTPIFGLEDPLVNLLATRYVPQLGQLRSLQPRSN